MQTSYQEYLQQIEEGDDTPDAIFAKLDQQENEHKLAVALERKVIQDLNRKGYYNIRLLDYGWTLDAIKAELRTNKVFSVIVLKITLDIVNKIIYIGSYQ